MLGCVDRLEEAGIPAFGPRENAAIIEGSKVFSKNLMKKYNIPTAQYEVFTDLEAALEYLETAPIPTVIKADGLALGKGVIIAETREDAKEVIEDLSKEVDRSQKDFKNNVYSKLYGFRYRVNTQKINKKTGEITRKKTKSKNQWTVMYGPIDDSICRKKKVLDVNDLNEQLIN